MKPATYYIAASLLLIALALSSCQGESSSIGDWGEVMPEDSIVVEEVAPEPQLLTGADITLEKALLYDQYTLEDVYEYQDTVRSFKWEQIKAQLAMVENHHDWEGQWGVLQNYRNGNKEAPLVMTWHRDEYTLVSDSLGIQRYQSAPLYLPTDTLTPRRYGRDGTPFHLLDSVGGFYSFRLIDTDEVWLTQKRYVTILPDSARFDHVVFIDVGDQNIATVERAERGRWLIRSMNPATTGRHKPPYAHETPLGVFVIQLKKPKMYYLKDGTSTIAGYAPHASRFTNGAYIHGVPINDPHGSIIEYSASLGTTPRSHMCVRNASSHAKFVYDWAPTFGTFVIVIE